MPVYEPDTRLQPVYVGDVAQVLGQLATRDGYEGQVWSLGGPDVMTMCQIIRFVLAETRRSRPILVVPRWLARLQASVLERLHGAMLTRDQLLMLSQDNVMPGPESGFEPFGIVPRSVAACVPAYLDRYRPGGERAEMAVDEL